MVDNKKIITSINIDKKTFNETHRLHAYNGYRSVSELVDKLLKDWLEKEAKK